MSYVTADKIEELRRLCGPEVDEQLRKGGEDGLDDATLARWLVARKGNMKDAARDLRAHASWRVAYVPEGRILEAEVRDELDQNKSFLPGYDKEGRPMCIVVVKNHIAGDAEMNKRYIAYSLDVATKMGRQNPHWDGKMSGFFDLRNMRLANCDLAALRNVFDLLQNHYPERLHKMWLYCAPVMFYGLWKMVYPFIDPVTREKVQFVNEKDAERELAVAFDLSVLPSEIQPGGTGQWISPEERYRMLVGQQQQQQQQLPQPAPLQQQHGGQVPEGNGRGREQSKESGSSKDATGESFEADNRSGLEEAVAAPARKIEEEGVAGAPAVLVVA